MIVLNEQTPGHSIPQRIEDAVLGRKPVCQPASPDAEFPMIYIIEAAEAAIDVRDAPKEKIHTAYPRGGCAVIS
jgi:hypothetical protein